MAFNWIIDEDGNLVFTNEAGDARYFVFSLLSLTDCTAVLTEVSDGKRLIADESTGERLSFARLYKAPEL